MARLRQVFHNGSDTSLILFLELSTSRYRLAPGEQRTLVYESDDEREGPGTPLRVEYMLDGAEPQITIYTAEVCVFMPDGKKAELDYS